MTSSTDKIPTSLRVSIVTQSGEHRLSSQPTSINSGPVVLSVSGHSNRNVYIDGTVRQLSNGATGVLSLDYKRSTGFHRVEVDGYAHWFATEDHKLKIEGVTRMLDHLRSLGTGWTGQALFSDGSGYLDPHVVYGWFDANADEALASLESILSAPRMDDVSSRALSRRGGAAVLTAPTIRLLRSDPRRNIIAQEGGVLSVSGREYTPTRVVASRRRRTVDTVANRRAVHLLDLISRLLANLSQAELPPKPRSRCQYWEGRVGRLSMHPLAITLRTKQSALVAPRYGPEYTDRSYIRVFDLSRSLDQFGWTASADPTRRYSYIESADRIYQAYAAHRVASALGLAQTPGPFGTNPLAFTGTDFDLYYDTVPPLEIIASWRANTVAPDASKPDLLLHEKSTGRVAVLDAKYRVGKDGYASEDSRKEVAAYQSLYGLGSVAILYPGVDHTVRVISDRGKSFVEIPVMGPDDGLAVAINHVLDRLELPPYV